MSAELNELKCREEEWDFRILSNRLLMKRTDRPDEWSMDELASMALTLEARVEELEERLETSSRYIGSLLGNIHDALGPRESLSSSSANALDEGVGK
tara:strand:- start:502 stop:792 length:291 start_codon:yes stop_codon:yes gene_type:complete